MDYTVRVIIAMLIWGSIGVFVKNVNLPPIEIVFLRAAIASMALVVIKIISSKGKGVFNLRRSSSKETIMLIVSGVILALNWLFLFSAYKYTTLTIATLCYYMAPVFIILAAPIILKEKLTLRSVIAVLIAMIGLGLIVSHQAQGTSMSHNGGLGVIFGLLAAVLYACVVLLNKSIKTINGFDKSLIQIFVSAVALLPMILYRNQLHIKDSKTLIFIIIVGVVHTAVSYVLYFSSIEHISAQKISLFSYIDPLSAVVFGTVLLGEPIGIFHIIGGVLILFSTLLSNR